MSSDRKYVVSSYEDQKTDPYDVNNLFSFLGLDLRFLESLGSVQAAFNRISKEGLMGSLTDTLQSFVGNQMDVLGELVDETTEGILTAGITAAQELGREFSDALLSRIYIADRVYLITLMGLKEIGSNIGYNENYIRSVAITHDLPLTLEWLDQNDKVSYDHTTNRRFDANTAARNSAIKVVRYILDKMLDSRREIERTIVLDEDGGEIKESVLMEYEKYFHKVIKDTIVNSYSNLDVPFLNKLINRFEIKPMAFGQNDSMYAREMTFSTSDINMMAPFYREFKTFTSELNRLQSDIGQSQTKYILPRNKNIKSIYIYLVNRRMFGDDLLIHHPLHERLSYFEMDTFTRTANRAGYHLVASGLGKAAFDITRSIHTAAYDYTRSIRNYLHNPRTLTYINVADNSKLPEPEPIPPEYLGYQSEEDPPHVREKDPYDGNEFKVLHVDELGFERGDIINSIFNIMDDGSKWKSFYDVHIPRVILDDEGDPVEVDDLYYVFTTYDKEYSGWEVQNSSLEKIIFNRMIKKWGNDYISVMEEEFPTKVDIIKESQDEIIEEEMLLTVGVSSTNDMYEVVEELSRTFGSDSGVLSKDEFEASLRQFQKEGNSIGDISDVLSRTTDIHPSDIQKISENNPDKTFKETNSVLYNKLGIGLVSLAEQVEGGSATGLSKKSLRSKILSYSLSNKAGNGDKNPLENVRSISEFLSKVYDEDIDASVNEMISYEVPQTKRVMSDGYITEIDINDDEYKLQSLVEEILTGSPLVDRVYFVTEI